MNMGIFFASENVCKWARALQVAIVPRQRSAICNTCGILHWVFMYLKDKYTELRAQTHFHFANKYSSNMSFARFQRVWWLLLLKTLLRDFCRLKKKCHLSMAAQLVVFELPIKHAHIIKHLQQLQLRGFCVYALPPNNSITSSQQEYPVQTFTVWNTLLQ